MQTRRSSFWKRALWKRWALAVGALCLWCSSVGTLRHTDDFSALLTFAATRNAVGHAAPLTPSVPCAAHEWEQTVPTLHAPSVHVAPPPLARGALTASLPVVLHLRAFDFTSLRGPPPA